MMNSDFGGVPAGSESGFPGMANQLSSMGLGGDFESLNGMSPYGSGVGQMQNSHSFGRSPYGAAPSNFMPTDSFAPFLGSPSMLTGAEMAGGFENFADSAPEHRYPLHEEEMPRPYPMARPRPRLPQQAPPQYEQDPSQGSGDDGSGDEQGPPQYEQGQQEQEGPQGYTNGQDGGSDEQQQAGYERQPESDQSQYQESGAPQEQDGGYQRSDYPRSKNYYDK